MPRHVTISLDLLQTFLTLLRHDGDAMQAAKELEVNQPSMSKRLGYLQHAGRVLKHPWLVRIGKKWRLTEEGRKVRPAVEDIVRRYEELTHFEVTPQAGKPQLKFACGQQAVTAFVCQAIDRFRRDYPDVQLRVLTLRGRERIERVANGSLDLATVTHDEAAIYEIARRPLHVELLRQDRLAVVCAEDASWSGQLRKLPKTRVAPKDLVGLPLILPEPDAGIRKMLDRTFRDQGIGDQLQTVLEIGGWRAILSYVRAGQGVGVVSELALNDEHGLIVRYLVGELFPPIATRLICRRVQGTGEALDLTDEAKAFREALRKAAEQWGK